MSDMSSGKITNLLANDTRQIELLHYYINYLWVCYSKPVRVGAERVL